MCVCAALSHYIFGFHIHKKKNWIGKYLTVSLICAFFSYLSHIQSLLCCDVLCLHFASRQSLSLHLVRMPDAVLRPWLCFVELISFRVKVDMMCVRCERVCTQTGMCQDEEVTDTPATSDYFFKLKI